MLPEGDDPMDYSIKNLQKDLYIGGRWRPASDGARFDVYDPATEEVLASVADATVEDALEAVAAAYGVGAAWAATPPRERAEAAYAAEFLRWFSEEAVRVLGEISTAPSGVTRMIVLRQPIAVSVFVTPWNFPAAMAARKIGPALAAGCTVVLKPAKETPLGPLVNAETRDKVAGLVTDALSQGAKLLTGGRAPQRQGYFYEPTVLSER